MVIKMLSTVIMAGLSLLAITVAQASADGGPGPQPKTQPTVVTLQPGDYLASIASANNSTFVRIFDANPQLASPDLIFPGEQLTIPAPDAQLQSRPLDEDQAPSSPPSPATTTSAPVSSSGVSGPWASLAQCESSGNWSINSGNGFYGGLQFTESSWRAAGGSGYPNEASPAEQIARAEILQSRQGWS